MYICPTMAFFTFPGEQEHRKFNYRPIYYDKDEEERRQTFGHVDGTFEKEKENGEYKPGAYIRGSLRNGNYAQRETSGGRSLKLIGIVGLICLMGILFYIAKYFELLFS